MLLVIGTALLMLWVGLALSVGAFLAGVLLADSEYRHELEAVIEPFKGLLLGLFFMAVGMSAQLDLLAKPAFLVFGIAAAGDKSERTFRSQPQFRFGSRQRAN